MTPRIRRGRTGDLGALLTLEATFPTDRLDRRAFRHALASPSMDCLVVVVSRAVAGYALMQRRASSDIARLTSIAVDPHHRGEGLGAHLLAACERTARRHGCRRLRLEVRADNARARRLYAGRGFARFATIEDYYEDGGKAHRFEKALG